MAAGFLITRVLLVCLLSELNYSSAFPTDNSGYSNVRKDGEKLVVRGYGTRRPLDYVRALRQPNRNPQLNDRSQIQKVPQGSLGHQSHTQIKKIVNPHHQKGVSSLQPPLSINNPSVNPRSFKIHLDVPLLDLVAQNERTDSSSKGLGNHGIDTQPDRQGSVQIQSSVNSPVSNILGNKYLSKYDYEGKKDRSVSKPSFQLDLSVPFPVTSKTSESPSHFLNLKPGGTLAQNRYMEPVKTQSGSTQIGSKWQPWLHTGTVHGREPQETGSKWSFLGHAGSGDQTQHKPVYIQPTDDKMSVSSWYSSQHRNPQYASQDQKPTGQSWGFQKPSVDKLPSLPISKYAEHPLVYISQTSPPREDGEHQSVYTDSSKYQSSWHPQWHNEVPSRGSGLYIEKNIAPSTSGPNRVHIESGTLDSDFWTKGSTKSPNEGKAGQDASKQSIQFTLTVPVSAKPADHIKNRNNHQVNIKPITTGSVDYLLPVKPQSNYAQTGLKGPLNLHTGHEQTLWQTHEPFHAKPADRKPIQSSWHPSQDKTPSELSWEFEKPSVTKFPSLSTSKYPEDAEVHSVHMSLPRKDYKDPTVLPDPFHRVSTPFYSAQAKPYGNGYVQKPISHSVGSPLRFSSESHNYLFKPSDRTQHVEMTHSGPLIKLDFPSSGSHFEVASSSQDAREAQRHASSPYQYSHRTEPSPDLHVYNPFPNSHTLTTAYNSQKLFPGQDADSHKQDDKGKFAGLVINLEHGGDSSTGKTYFAAETPHKHGYISKWTGKNTAGEAINSNPTHVNLQVSVKKDSLKELLESSFPNKVQFEQNNPRYQFSEGVSYSPGAQINAGSVPKNAQVHFSGGLQALQDAFRFQQ